MKLIVQCVACKHKQDASGATDISMCEKCFSPTVPVEAKS